MVFLYEAYLAISILTLVISLKALNPILIAYLLKQVVDN
jgi:hypothetical protein